MSRPTRRARTTLAALAAALAAALSLSHAGPGRAADLFVIETTIERPDAPTASPTFMVTPGERALVALEGEPRLDAAMTLSPADGAAADDFELKVELIEAGRALADTVRVRAGQSATVALETGDVTVRLVERPGLEQGPDEIDPPVSSPPTAREDDAADADRDDGDAIAPDGG